MHPLLAALAAWPGRQATKSALEAKGYWVPERYKKMVLAHCDDCDEGALEFYWNEVALEYFCSAGRVDSGRRVFSGDTSYRSKHLDDLAALHIRKNGKLDGFPLEDGLRRFRSKIYSSTHIEGIHLGRWISNKISEYKQDEITNFHISAAGWTGTRKDFAISLGKLAEARGFVFFRKKWRKSFGPFLEFSCNVDSGMRTTWTFQIPVVLEIVHRSAPDFVFHLGLRDALIPGFDYYRSYHSPESAVLGMQAQIDLFDIVGELTVNHAD